MEKLSAPLLLVISVISNCVFGLGKGCQAKRTTNFSRSFWQANLLLNVCALITLVLLFLPGGGLRDFSLFSVLWGVLMGVLSVVCVITHLLAFSMGPFAYTNVLFLLLSTLIASLSGLLFGETISALQVIGILLIVVCMCLSTERKQSEQEKKASLRWLLAAMAAGVTSGAIGVIQKLLQSSAAHHAESGAFTVSGFVAASVLSLFPVLWRRRSAAAAPESKAPASLWGYTVAVGITLGILHCVNLLVAGKLPAVIAFPVMNTCPMLLTTVLSVFLFKEKLSLTRWVGIGIGVVAVLLVSGIF